MLKTVTALFILFLGLISCVQHSEETDWPHEQYWYSLRGTHQEGSYLPLKIIKASKDTSTEFIYLTPFDTTTYTIDLNHLKETDFQSSYPSEKLFYFVEEHNVVIDGEDFKVYQFSTADGTIDSGSEHYWTKNLGFFFIRSTTWSIYRVLQFENEEKNKEVWKLVKQIYPRIEQSLKLAGVPKDLEHIRQEQYKVVEWDWRK